MHSLFLIFISFTPIIINCFMENEGIFSLVHNKGNLKQDIYQITYQAFQEFKNQAKELVSQYDEFTKVNTGKRVIPFLFKDKGNFEFELIFGGDVLLFLMHTNVFEIPRTHELMLTQYVKEDKTRSYCGLIHIYNFLADSFKYGRENDAGYLIGRLLVNKESHYFIEGKKEIGLIFHNFQQSILDQQAIHRIITSSVEYTVNFDLLIPPFESVAFISVMDVLRVAQSNTMRTGKRLGFKFQADSKDVQGLHNDK